MSESQVPELGHHQRRTLEMVFQHPLSHNLEWHDALSLFEALGTVEERHDAKLNVVLGESSHVFLRPKHKDVAVEDLVEMRKLLRAAGLAPTES